MLNVWDKVTQMEKYESKIIFTFQFLSKIELKEQSSREFCAILTKGKYKFKCFSLRSYLFV